MTVYLFIAKGRSWGTDKKVRVADPKEYAKELIRLNPGVIEVSWMTLGKDFGKVYGKIQCPTPRVRNKRTYLCWGTKRRSGPASTGNLQGCRNEEI